VVDSRSGAGAKISKILLTCFETFVIPNMHD